MSVMLVFDVHGTLECGDPRGPVRLKSLRALKAENFVVGIVGAYEKVQKRVHSLDFYYDGDPHKDENLRKVMEEYKPKLAFYVADRPSDREVALKNGFCYVRPEDFTLPQS